MPDSHLPDSRCPILTCPIPDARFLIARSSDARLQMPDSHLPESQMPHSHFPDSGLPDSKCPILECPTLICPILCCPTSDARFTDTPSKIPGFQTPDSHSPTVKLVRSWSRIRSDSSKGSWGALHFSDSVVFRLQSLQEASLGHQRFISITGSQRSERAHPVRIREMLWAKQSCRNRRFHRSEIFNILRCIHCGTTFRLHNGHRDRPLEYLGAPEYQT